MRTKTRCHALLLLGTSVLSCVEPASPAGVPVVIAGANARQSVSPSPPVEPSAGAKVVANEAETPDGGAAARLAKIPPEALKQYRVDVCYYGTFSLRQGRDDYLAKLGGQRPGPRHVPTFVDPPLPAAPVRFEKYARSCVAAAALRDPDFGDVDTAIAVFASIAVQLAKDMTAARTYYQTGDHAIDGFLRGGELHDALTAGFTQLDALHDRLGAAVAARRKSHPPKISHEAERICRAAVEDAQAVLLLAVATKLDGKALDAAIRQLGQSVQAFRAWQSSNPSDPWAKILAIPLENFRQAVEAPRPPHALRLESVAVNETVLAFVLLVEARQRAISREAMTKPSSGAP